MTALFSKENKGAAISRDELAALAKLGARHGSLGPQESQLMENILRLRHTRTEEILTPRTVVSAIAARLTVSEALEAIEEMRFTRLPVFEEDLDTIIGLVLRPQLLNAERNDGGENPLTDYVIPIYRVSEELPVLRLLDLFIKRREHLFLVEDQYGQTAGIVTLEDAVETLLGREIMDESDEIADMQELARNKYRGRLRESRDD